jgi:hypothetical protein
MDVKVVSKVAFLAFVVVLAVYIVIANKDPVVNTEKFTNAPKDKIQKSEQFTTTEAKSTKSTFTTPVVKQPLREQIIEVYVDLFGSGPNKEELSFYEKFFKNSNASKDYIKEIISVSAPTLKKTLKVGKSVTSFDIANGSEDEVIAIFNEILNRNPDVEELRYYSTFIKQGPSHVEKMKLLLIHSEEYKRLQKMQTNLAFGQLLGGITDRQLTLMVTSIYDNITNTKDKLDDETLKFLKKKYLEFELNESVFRKFVKDVVLFKPTSTLSTPPSKVTPSKTVNYQVINTLEQYAFDTNTSNTNNTSNTSNTTNSTTNSTTKPATTTLSTATKPTTTTSTLSTSGGVNTAKVIESVKSQAKCQFDKNAIDNKNRNNNETSLSSTINQRNRDELKNICERNSAYSKFHDEPLTLLPGQEWSVPYKRPPVCLGGTPDFQPLMTQTALLGTLIGDAHGRR